MSVHFVFSEEKKPDLSGGKLTEDLDADHWAILNIPTPIKSHQAIPKAYLHSLGSFVCGAVM